MHLCTPVELDRLADYIGRFIELVGRERWFRRVDQLNVEQRKSPHLWKIVADYHWLEIAISYQADVLAKEGHLIPELTDALSCSALRRCRRESHAWPASMLLVSSLALHNRPRPFVGT